MVCTLISNKSAVLSDFPFNNLVIEADGDAGCAGETLAVQFKVTNTNTKRNVIILTATAGLFDSNGMDKNIPLAPEFLPGKTIECNNGCILIRFTVNGNDWLDGDFVKLISLTFNTEICTNNGFQCP
ncbi:MAG: hypothetical protein H6850_04135 [Alphaproteobacteria bacterium]|nr:MAG: hypothetical protein H6850_04135 [Alphaproteobacteria bacterium]